MPAPMTAPTPSAVNWTGPSVRFRLCSPSSFASSSNMLIGFLANKGLPMQLLLLGDVPASGNAYQFGCKHCRGAACCAPTRKIQLFRITHGRGPPGPAPINGDAQEDNDQARPGR